MKRRARLLAAAGAAILLLAAVGYLKIGRRPFRGLDAAEILSASVWLTPPDVTAELDREEIETLAELLRQVRVSRRDDSYTDYCGQGVIFTLTMTDGTVTEVVAFNPFLIIDGGGWRMTHQSRPSLNSFGNHLYKP